MAENREILCEELINYIIYPNTDKMKDIPAYREGTKEFEEAHIYLQNYKTGSYACVTCIMVDLQKKIYITEGNFNKYWSIIVKLLERIRNAYMEELLG